MPSAFKCKAILSLRLKLIVCELGVEIPQLVLIRLSKCMKSKESLRRLRMEVRSMWAVGRDYIVSVY